MAEEKWSRRRKALLSVAVLLVLLPLTVWLLRHPIAAHFVDRELTRRGVEARYRITSIGFGRQVLEDVRLGPAAAPDLTARRIVVRTAVGFSGVALTGIEAEGVRLRGRYVGGRLRLGQIDRLLPPPSGVPFRFPDLPLRLRDVRATIASQAGTVALRIHGQGNPSERFDGRLSVATPRLAARDCAASDVAGQFSATVRQGAPTLAGPLLAASLDCGDRGTATDFRAYPRVAISRSFDRVTADLPLRLASARVAGTRATDVGARLTLTYGEGQGRVAGDVAAGRVASGGWRGTGVAARMNLAGDTARIDGPIRFTAARVNGLGGSARSVALAGPLRLALGTAVTGGWGGRVRASQVTLPAGTTASLANLDKGLNGTPLEAIARRIGASAQAAARSFALDGDAALELTASSRTLQIGRLAARSASGARVALDGGRGVKVRLDDLAGATIDSTVAVGGGGLPKGKVRLTRDSTGAVSGVATVAPYQAGNSRIALSPVRFSRAAAGRTRVDAIVALTGAFAGGRVENARMPLSAVLDPGGAVTVNARCAPLRFDRLALSGAVFEAASLTLCPAGNGAVVRRASGGVASVGVRLPDPALTGRIGSTPLSLAASDALFRLDAGRFSASNVRARVGQGVSVTRLDLGSLDGGFLGKGAKGRFTGAEGRVGAVPILWSEGTGDWVFRTGRLSLTADLAIDDAADPARFTTLRAPGFGLTFAGSLIDAAGPLTDPQTGRTVADVTIEHSFLKAAGEARLAVRALLFDQRLQPSRLTPLALGVVADVQGRVSGDARIVWGGAQVQSTGTFTTKGMDLAAAFGPVQRLSTTVRFTDLLNLITADDQLLTVDQINPGTAVLDGVVRYAIVPGRLIAIRSGRWPFGGGTLTLQPTILEFGEGKRQDFVVAVAGLDAAVLLNDFGFDNISATGVFDGAFPLSFVDGNGTVVGGHLDSRPPGGTVAYVGAVSQEDLGFFGNLAFDALRSLRYDGLEVTLNGPLSGSMVTGLRFDGIAQGAGAKRNILARTIAGLPFVFKITVNAPLRQLLGSARSFSDPSLLVEQNLGLLYREQKRETGTDPLPPIQAPIQEQESEPTP